MNKKLNAIKKALQAAGLDVSENVYEYKYLIDTDRPFYDLTTGTENFITDRHDVLFVSTPDTAAFYKATGAAARRDLHWEGRAMYNTIVIYDVSGLEYLEISRKAAESTYNSDMAMHRAKIEADRAAAQWAEYYARRATA